MQASSSQPKLLIIGYVWPEPNSSAAGSRMMQLISQFLSQGWCITFASPAKQGDHKENLVALGVYEVAIQLNHVSFDDFVSQLSPDAVLFDRFMMEEQFGWRVEKYAPNAIRILNTEDLHSLRDVRQQMIKDALKKQSPQALDLSCLGLQSAPALFQAMAQSDMAKREIAAIFRSDITLIISEFELELLQQYFQVPAQQLCYLPLLYPEQTDTAHLGFKQRQHFMTIGNFRHEPNWDAVRWLHEAIWPLIRQQLPDAQLHIYGAYPPKKATQLHNSKQGFHIMGWAQSAPQTFQQARICLAPLRFGAGIKGKLAEAMCYGTPSITTLIGAESMQNSRHRWPGEVANDARTIAHAAVALYQDETRWNKAQQDGLDTFSSRFSHSIENPSASIANWWQQLSSLQQQLVQHRQNNFIGAMLNHHHHKSTQYMAQWIEAKNR